MEIICLVIFGALWTDYLLNKIEKLEHDKADSDAAARYALAAATFYQNQIKESKIAEKPVGNL